VILLAAIIPDPGPGPTRRMPGQLLTVALILAGLAGLVVLPLWLPGYLGTSTLELVRVPPPLDAHPDASIWEQAPPVLVPVQQQAFTMPALDRATIATVTLQGLHDGEHVAWRLSWEDPSRDDRVDQLLRTDAAALQLPLSGQPPFTMGGPGEPVQILHWKALWQREAVTGPGREEDPLADRLPGDPMDRLLPRRVGNHLAGMRLEGGAEELIAEGFGTATHQEQCVTVAQGIWRDGRWAVTFMRPLRTGDEQDAQLQVPGRSWCNVAVWDGTGDNVGGRKHHATWIPLWLRPW
jgi:hypothetical protein